MHYINKPEQQDQVLSAEQFDTACVFNDISTVTKHINHMNFAQLESGFTKACNFGNYDILKLITFFTVGPKECRAWTVKNGATAPNAAGVIHTDFETGFIRAETISGEDYVALNGEDNCKNAGKMRLEGKDYIVVDGDVFHFRFNN